MSLASTSVAGTRAARYSLLTVELPGAAARHRRRAARRPRRQLRPHPPAPRLGPVRARRSRSALAARRRPAGPRRANGSGPSFWRSSKIRFRTPSASATAARPSSKTSRARSAACTASMCTAAAQPFVTHLPRYSLAVAAGPFLENRVIEEEAWEEAPPELASDPRNVRSPHRRTLHGTAHSGPIAVRVPPRRQLDRARAVWSWSKRSTRAATTATP